MMTASDVIKQICTDLAGVNLQTIVREADAGPGEGQVLLNYDCVARVNIHVDARHVLVSLTFEEDEDFENFLDSMASMNEFDTPDDGRELINIITLMPKEMQEGIVSYAAGYLGLYLADDDELVVQLMFDRSDFAVFGLDTDALEDDPDEFDAEEGEPDDDEVVTYDELKAEVEHEEADKDK